MIPLVLIMLGSQRGAGWAIDAYNAWFSKGGWDFAYLVFAETLDFRRL